jgi:protein-L-isoaspartate(D-aspartate) O-methyltransferase
MIDETALRRWYAEDLRLRAPIRNHLSIADAFATVPRERFVGQPPWRLLSDRLSQAPFDTPDGALGWLHHDVLVVIDATRALNNGLPSLWARSFDQLDLRRGQRVMQVGAGTGYYAAILAEVVGPEGRVVAVEVDAELAARARESLAPWRNIEVVAGDGCTHDPGEVDIIIVCAGATHPAPLWLDRLAPRGQLLMPLTTDDRWGFLLRATRGDGRDTDLIVLPKARHRDGFDATSVGPVGIYPCVGGRDDAAAKRLDAALTEIGRGSWFAPVPISALHRGAPSGEEMEKVWYYGPGFWLERAA